MLGVTFSRSFFFLYFNVLFHFFFVICCKIYLTWLAGWWRSTGRTYSLLWRNIPGTQVMRVFHFFFPFHPVHCLRPYFLWTACLGPGSCIFVPGTQGESIRPCCIFFSHPFYSSVLWPSRVDDGRMGWSLLAITWRHKAGVRREPGDLALWPRISVSILDIRGREGENKGECNKWQT